MSLTGLMIYYDEPLDMLAAAVTSFAPAIDHLVVLDGAYDMFPGSVSQPVSPVEQSRIILEVAAALKLPVTLHRPTQSWAGNEVAKRQASLDIARATYGLGEDDWVVIFDADNVATYAAPDLGAFLDSDDEHCVATYALEVTGHGGGYTPCRGIYRMLEGLSYGPTHWSVSAPVGVDDRIWLWGDLPGMTEALPLDATSLLKVTHRDKPRDRREAAKQYYRLREQFGLEKASQIVMEDVDGNTAVIA